jgi:hypothetical protein
MCGRFFGMAAIRLTHGFSEGDSHQNAHRVGLDATFPQRRRLVRTSLAR